MRRRKGWKVGDVARRSDGLGTGYLSLVERGERRLVHPNTLRRIAEAYDEPYELLLKWVGYLDELPEISANARRVLRSLGPDPSEEEVEACRQALQLVRGTGGQPYFERLLSE